MFLLNNMLLVFIYNSPGLIGDSNLKSLPLESDSLNTSHSNPGRREKINLIFIVALPCGASKGFMKAKEVQK